MRIDATGTVRCDGAILFGLERIWPDLLGTGSIGVELDQIRPEVPATGNTLAHIRECRLHRFSSESEV